MSASRAAKYRLVRGSILYVWLTAVRWVLRCRNKSSTTIGGGIAFSQTASLNNHRHAELILVGSGNHT